MPYSPDYSDYLKFKRQQSALTTDRQIAERKKRSVVPFSSYDPNYRILSYPPNIFTPSRLIPQPNPPTPSVTPVIMTLNVEAIDFSSSGTYDINLRTYTGATESTSIEIHFTNDGSANNHFESINNLYITTTTYQFAPGVIINTTGGGSVTGDGDNKNTIQLFVTTPISINTVIALTLVSPVTATELDNPVLIVS